MVTIHKYAMPAPGERWSVDIPKGAWFLSMQLQGDALVAWFMVDDMDPKEKREFTTVGTGFALPADALKWDHFGTVQVGAFVWHVFEVGAKY